MSNIKTVRVGVMPGQIKEYATAVGTPINELLQNADLDASGYDVKIDGEKVDPNSASVTDSTKMVLLAKQVKGNSVQTVRVGVMPGQIKEYAVEAGAKVSDVLAQAELDPSGYDVKVDGEKVDPSSATINASTKMILLAKQVKGNK